MFISDRGASSAATQVLKHCHETVPILVIKTINERNFGSVYPNFKGTLVEKFVSILLTAVVVVECKPAHYCEARSCTALSGREVCITK